MRPCGNSTIRSTFCKPAKASTAAPPVSPEMLRGDFLPLRRVQIMQVFLGGAARAVPVRDHIHQRHWGLREYAHRRRNLLKLVLAKFLERQKCFVLPGPQHTSEERG